MQCFEIIFHLQVTLCVQHTHKMLIIMQYLWGKELGSFLSIISGHKSLSRFGIKNQYPFILDKASQ